MRLSWLGSTGQVAVCTLFPVVLTIVLFVLAAQEWAPMTLSFLFLLPFLTFPREKYFCLTLDSFFHAKVFFSSIVIVVFIYERFVVPQLTVTFTENTVFAIFMTVAGICYYATHVRSDGSNFDALVLTRHCDACKKTTHYTDFHSTWYGCCIGIQNRGWYLISITSLMAGLFSCAYLTLTTVCRPYELITDFILVPEDCGDVFIQWQYSICFVSGVFSLIFSTILCIIMVREIFFISIGLTVTGWRCLPTLQKMCLGLYSQRPCSKGFIANWLQVIRMSYV